MTLSDATVWISVTRVQWNTIVSSPVTMESNNLSFCTWHFWRNWWAQSRCLSLWSDINSHGTHRAQQGVISLFFSQSSFHCTVRTFRIFSNLLFWSTSLYTGQLPSQWWAVQRSVAWGNWEYRNSLAQAGVLCEHYFWIKARNLLKFQFITVYWKLSGLCKNFQFVHYFHFRMPIHSNRFYIQVTLSLFLWMSCWNIPSALDYFGKVVLPQHKI